MTCPLLSRDRSSTSGGKQTPAPISKGLGTALPTSSAVAPRMSLEHLKVQHGAGMDPQGEVRASPGTGGLSLLGLGGEKRGAGHAEPTGGSGGEFELRSPCLSFPLKAALGQPVGCLKWGGGDGAGTQGWELGRAARDRAVRSRRHGTCPPPPRDRGDPLPTAPPGGTRNPPSNPCPGFGGGRGPHQPRAGTLARYREAGGCWSMVLDGVRQPRGLGGV